MRILRTLLVGLFILGFVSSAHASDKTMKEYGRIRILSKTGAPSALAPTGSDGYYQAGSVTSPRFVDNGDGTISDRDTGLMWVKQPELIIPGASVIASNQIQVAQGTWAIETVYAVADLIYDDIGGLFYVCAVGHTSGSVDFATDLAAHPTYWRQTIWTASAANLATPSTMTWANNLTNCMDLTYAGFSDWRSPNVRELLSILTYNEAPPYNEFFPNWVRDYWSSTQTPEAFPFAAHVDFSNDSLAFANKSSTLAVRPVRGGGV